MIVIVCFGGCLLWWWWFLGVDKNIFVGFRFRSFVVIVGWWLWLLFVEFFNLCFLFLVWGIICCYFGLEVDYFGWYLRNFVLFLFFEIGVNIIGFLVVYGKILDRNISRWCRFLFYREVRLTCLFGKLNFRIGV